MSLRAKSLARMGLTELAPQTCFEIVVHLPTYLYTVPSYDKEPAEIPDQVYF